MNGTPEADQWNASITFLIEANNQETYELCDQLFCLRVKQNKGVWFDSQNIPGL